VILLENYGSITLGRTAAAVLAAMFMAEKTAAIWVARRCSAARIFFRKNTWRASRIYRMNIIANGR
jgi:hypothetical protein